MDGRWRSRKLNRSEPFKTALVAGTPAGGEAGTVRAAEGTEATRVGTGARGARAAMAGHTDPEATGGEGEVTEAGATVEATEGATEQGVDMAVARMEAGWAWPGTAAAWEEGMAAAWGTGRAGDTAPG